MRLSGPKTSVGTHGSGDYPLRESRAEPMEALLRVSAGSDPGLTCAVGERAVSIGTAGSNDFVIHDACVSRVHCQIVRRGGRFLVRDLGSTNGTYVDGQRVQEAVVTSASVIVIGDTELRLDTLSERAGPPGPSTFGEMVACSSAMKQLFGSLRSVAHSPLTCLLLGATGTGKELCARAIHEHSPRRAKPFLVVDCAAMGPQFIEDKLFGHQRGAFTGAHEAMAGVFEEARGGTVFLDEIGELPLALQPKLLGVLERRQATRIGSHTPVSLDVRVIAATHRDLTQMVAEGSFRQDLLYRLGEYSVRIPPLRERPEDIVPIAMAILQREGFTQRLTEDAASYLERQPWPGNVRELRNTLRRAAVLATDALIDAALFEEIEPITSVTFVDASSAFALEPRQPSAPADPAAEQAFEMPFEEATEAFRREYVRALRQRFGNDLQRAASHAGIHPKSVSRLFRTYGVY